MTALLEETDTEAVTEQVETHPVASWLSRAGALSIDVLFPLGVVAAVALVALTAPFYSWLWWVSVAVGAVIILLTLLNRILAPELTGWSLGRALFSIRVMRRDGESAGVLRLFAREFAHLLDTAALFIGWLWPLWDSRNRTFADLLLRTEARRIDEPRPDVRRVAAAVLTAGAVIAAAGAGVTYLMVYRHEQAVDAARAQIAEQGPRIVEEILTYNAGTLKDDFARAQSLVTDSYREQLVRQQESVQKNAAASNEYWAVTTSVLSAGTDQATMLMFLQGQRQAQQQELRFITATARVGFQKSPDGKWRVADLTVLQQPVLGKAPQ